MKNLINFSVIVAIINFLAISSALCEYRAFQYYVKSRYHLPHDTNAYLVTSTLNPVSYLSYHGGSQSIKVDLVRTWTCKGNTSGRIPICQAPLESSKLIKPKE